MFNFAIGDSVAFNGTVKEAAAINAADDKIVAAVPQRFEVVGRMSDECTAGTQYHYFLRPVAAGRVLSRMVGIAYTPTQNGLCQANQCELVAYPSTAKG